MWRHLRLVLTLGLGLLLAGCPNTVGDLLVTKSQKEKEIATLTASYEAKIMAARSEETAAKNKVIAGKDAQIAGAVNGLYGADSTFHTIMNPTRKDLVTNNFINEAWAALGRQQPTYEAMQKTNERLKTELDEVKTSIADLSRNHQAALAENNQLAEATKQFADQLAAAEKARVKLDTDFHSQLEVKQATLIETQAKLVAAEKASAEDAKARQAQLARLSWGAGIIAALCLLGSIFSPIGKSDLAWGAAAFGGAAICIPFVQGWWILAALGVVAAVLIIRNFREQHQNVRGLDALNLALNDAKEHAKEAYAVIEPMVAERLKKYVTKGGKIMAEEDHALQVHLDKNLASWDAK